MPQMPAKIWQRTQNKMIAYKVHLSFFVIGLGLTPEAAWMDLDKQIKPMTIATMRRFMYSPFLYRFSAVFRVFHEVYVFNVPHVVHEPAPLRLIVSELFVQR